MIPINSTGYCWCIIVSLLNVSQSQQNISEYDVAEFIEHSNSVDRFKCGSPQPRLINVSHLFKDASKIYLPKFTVLYR